MPSIKTMVCTKCGLSKHIEEFPVRPNRRNGREEQCKQCVSNRAKAYRKANIKQYKASYKASNLANVDKLKEWYLDNVEKVKATGKAYYLANTEKIRIRHKVYSAAHSEEARGYVRKRRALKMLNYHEPYRDTDVFGRDGWICGVCGQKINKRLKWPNPRSMSIDHIIPLSKGGADAPINLQGAHLRCNRGKSANNGGQLRLIN